jgi:hypothetical protein
MNQKNRDLPAYPIKFNDQFGQLVILGGMTKLELVAMTLFNARMNEISYYEDINYTKKAIKQAYNTAELFCSHIEDKLQQESKIIS